MNRPGIFDGVVFAVIVSLGAGFATLLLGGLLVYGVLFELLLYAATLVYLLYLLKRSSARVGRVVVIAGWALVSLACWFLDIALLQQVLIQAGVIWLVRSLYFHASLAAALLDFGLVCAGLAAAAWALVNTGSLAAALWSFFLLQALFCWLPQLGRKRDVDITDDRQRSSFDSAHRVALDAVRKLSQS